MREVEKIINKIKYLRDNRLASALATVVDVSGSAYRLPGARMLTTDSEWLAGSISGGCLENDIVERAKAVIANNTAAVVTYDTSSDDDIVFGVGLGCRGVIRILLEPVAVAPGAADLATFAENCFVRQERGTVASVISGDAAKTGARLLWSAGRTVATDILDSRVVALIESQLANADSAAMEPSIRAFDVAGKPLEVFFETIKQPTPLVIFGAGHDAMPLVQFAKELGWHVTVVDHRPAYATQKRFPSVDVVAIAGKKRVPDGVQLTDETLAVVMTHNYLRDLDLLNELLDSPVRYIGLLGPRRRSGELLEELSQRGRTFNLEKLRRFYAPVGLDLGGENPSEVALSIISEMQAVLHARVPAHLKNRVGSIHGGRHTIANETPASTRPGRSNALVCPTMA